MELVAKRAGVSRMTLYKAESGDAATTLGTCIRILAALGMERVIAQVAGNDEIGRRLQDMRLETWGPKGSKSSAGEAADAAVVSTRRPHTLREVVLWGRVHGDTDAFLREFLDDFYAASDPRTSFGG